MFRFIHTADWHLGQLFHHHSRQYEHQQFLTWLVQQVQHYQPHAVLIAGDIFDVVNPASAAQKQLYQFLADVHQIAPSTQIVMIAGNHDSGYRIEQVSPLLNKYNSRAVGIVEWQVNEQGQRQLNMDHFLIPLHDHQANVVAWCVALPFLRSAEITTYETAIDVQQASEQIYQHLIQAVQQRKTEKQAVILMSHAHLQGGEESKESERPIVIGHQEALSVERILADQVDYVALGHLHKAQKVKYAHVRYSGSPIPLSFSELKYKHQVMLVDIDEQHQVSYQPLFVPQTVKLIALRGSLEDIFQQIKQLEAKACPLEQRPFVAVEYESQQIAPPDLYQQIEQALPENAYRLVRLVRKYQREEQWEDTSQHMKRHLEPPTPEQLFQRIVQQGGYECDEQLLQDFRQLQQQVYEQHDDKE